MAMVNLEMAMYSTCVFSQVGKVEKLSTASSCPFGVPQSGDVRDLLIDLAFFIRLQPFVGIQQLAVACDLVIGKSLEAETRPEFAFADTRSWWADESPFR